MAFARLAGRPRSGAFLCMIAATLAAGGCHSVPVAQAHRRAAKVAVAEPDLETVQLARGQSQTDRLQSSRRAPRDVAPVHDSTIPWGHVGAVHPRTDEYGTDVTGSDLETPAIAPRHAAFANHPATIGDADDADPQTAEPARRRLGLLPPPSGRMALTDFNDPIRDQPEPDWIEPAPSENDEAYSGAGLPESCHTINWRDDLHGVFPMLWDDTLSLFNWRSGLALGAAAGGAIAIRENLDGRVREHTARNPQKWGEASEVLRQFGEFRYQVPALAAVYGLSLWTEDDHLHEFSGALISAYTLSSAATVAIKGITNTQRPSNQFQDGEYGFPSFHTSSTFSIASVIDEYYGWKAGVPAYVLAGFVGWSRIDQREHDLSDVAFGAALGFVIGKTVSAAHIERHTNMQVMPYYDPVRQTGGVQFEKRY